MTIAVAQVEPKLEAGAARRLVSHRSNGGLESRLFQDVGMECENGVSELRDRLDQCAVGSAEGRLTDRNGGLLAHATTTCLVFER